MSYPAIGLSQGRAVVDQLRAKSPVDVIAHSRRVSVPELDDEAQVDAIELLAKLKELLESQLGSSTAAASGRDRDRVEGGLSLDVYERLATLGPRTLSDPDFWRFASVFACFKFTQWRDGEESKYASFGLESYSRMTECVPFRMYARGYISTRAARKLEGLSAEEIAISGGTDFWRSHILRVHNRFDHELVGMMAEASIAGLLPTSKVRSVAKVIKERRANLLIELLDQGDRADLFSDIMGQSDLGSEE